MQLATSARGFQDQWGAEGDGHCLSLQSLPGWPPFWRPALLSSQELMRSSYARRPSLPTIDIKMPYSHACQEGICAYGVPEVYKMRRFLVHKRPIRHGSQKPRVMPSLGWPLGHGTMKHLHISSTHRWCWLHALHGTWIFMQLDKCRQ